MITIQEALRELWEDSSKKILHGNTKYPQMHSLRELLKFYDFLFYEKHLSSDLVDSHFSLTDQNNYSDATKDIAVNINKQVSNRQLALARYLGLSQDKTPGNNLYASVDINTQGNIGTIRLLGWNVHGNHMGLNEFKSYLKEFYETQTNYSPEVIQAYLDLLQPSSKGVRLISSKDRGTILQVSFGLDSRAPQMFKRTYQA